LESIECFNVFGHDEDAATEYQYESDDAQKADGIETVEKVCVKVVNEYDCGIQLSDSQARGGIVKDIQQL
jgi:hypothetical protein